ncbi:BTAD domain-containing putative transcriptional regulator [Salinispira pacifica]
MITVSVLGPPEITRDSKSIRLGRKKAAALLVFLVMSRQWHTRDFLAAFLWPEQSQEEARASLRKALFVIRSALGGSVFDFDEDRVRFGPAGNVSVDALRLHDAALPGGDRLTGVPGAEVEPVGALSLYRGEFLSGFSLPECSDFTEWQLRQAENSRADAIILAERSIRLLLDRNDTAGAIDVGRKWLEIDPLDEQAHLWLIRLYGRANQLRLGLRQYDQCVRMLDREFDAEPSAETEAAVAALRAMRGKAAAPVASTGSATAAAAAPPAGPAARSRFLLPFLLSAVVGTGLLSLSPAAQFSTPSPVLLVVRPLASSPDLEDRFWYQKGFSSVLASELSRCSGLRVIAPSASDAAGSDEAIARTLGARYVLTGLVRTDSTSPRVRIRLADGRSGREVWSAEYDGRPQKLLEAAGSAVREIAAAAGAGPPTESAITAPGDTSAEAFRDYLYGLYYMQREITADTVSRAMARFEQAVAQDPGYAPAVAALANCYWASAQFGTMAPESAMPRALELADRAISLNPQLAGPHVVRAFVLYLFEWNWAVSEVEFKTALRLNPSSVDAFRWYGSLLTTLGRHEEAIRAVQQAKMLDPASPLNIVNVAARLYYGGHYEAAIREADEALELEPGFWMGDLVRGDALAALGRYNEAVDALARAETNGGGLEPACFRVYALGRAGRTDEAVALLSRIEQESDAQFLSPFLLACAWAGIGNSDRALALLDQAVEQRDLNLVWDLRDPAMKLLRNSPRFSALLSRLGLNGQAR